MRIILLSALLVLVLVISTVSTTATTPIAFSTQDAIGKFITSTSSTQKISVGSFNIQVFGTKKASNDMVMRVLVSTISQYDICLVMEIRDSSDTAIYKLLGELNAATQQQNVKRNYRIAISERLGRTTSKEQYAYIYDSNKVRVVAEYQYHDIHDYFERPPYSVIFQPVEVRPDSTEHMLWLTGLHTKPTEAVSEITNMVETAYTEFATSAEKQTSMSAASIEKLLTHTFVFMGDLNAACSYASNAAVQRMEAIEPKILRGSKLNWLTNQDSTVRRNGCAYDRVIAVPALSETTSTMYISNVKVFDFETALGLTREQALLVSDHFPVEFTVHYK